MKRWPTTRTLLNGVTQSSLDQWHYWQRQIPAIARTILVAAVSEEKGIKLQPWTTKLALMKQLEEAEKQAEICRMICRRQDIQSRWIMWRLDRPYRKIPKKPDVWQPTPMLMDQYIERGTRRLREDL